MAKTKRHRRWGATVVGSAGLTLVLAVFEGRIGGGLGGVITTLGVALIIIAIANKRSGQRK